jgi:hypothetical protein
MRVCGFDGQCPPEKNRVIDSGARCELGDCCEHLCRQFWTLLWYIFSIPDNFVQ